MAAIHAVCRWGVLGRGLGSAISLPDLPAPPPHADPHRFLDARPVRRSEDRVHLPLRTWDTKGGGAPDHRPSGAGLGAARGYLERAVLTRRNRKVNRKRACR